VDGQLPHAAADCINQQQGLSAQQAVQQQQQQQQQQEVPRFAADLADLELGG
jgi:hypothetical protein